MAAGEALMSMGVKASLLAALEGIETGAVAAHLPAQTARALVIQTLKGTALVLSDSGESPALLKDRVASPGGTTIAGLGVLEDRAVRGTVMGAMEWAANSAEKGKES